MSRVARIGFFGNMSNPVIPPQWEVTQASARVFGLEPVLLDVRSVEAITTAFSDAVQDEDRQICEVVQKNLRSRVYDRGRYAPKQEQGVHHFHALLHEFLS